MELGLGIDTGGTYTDAVLIDMQTGALISKAKALTTRDDLSAGIENSLKKFDKDLFKNVTIVSLSSTLATNSVVEGKGCRVGLVSVGKYADNSIKADKKVFISGGHDSEGEEVQPLDVEAAEEFMKSIAGKVDSLAVSSLFSIRNPEHENIIKSMAQNILDVPVVCGHELSSSLGFAERTLTTVINARLIPVIRELITSMKQVMAAYGINAPLMIVKGDGSIMNDDMAVEKPVETILSGPAASLIGAKTLTGLDDAIVMDMGGTTTDIGILRNGRPKIEEEGAIIGEKRTHVLAVEAYTSGIGGDSRFTLKNNKLQVTSLRVVPLCIAAAKWPQLLARLKKTANSFSASLEDIRNSNPSQDIEFFIKIKDVCNINFSENDLKFLNYISNEPFSLNEVSEALRIPSYEFNPGWLEELGVVQRIGFTPTDVLHAEGSYVVYEKQASEYGASYLSQKARMPYNDFISSAKGLVIRKLSEELLKKLFLEKLGPCNFNELSSDLIDMALRQDDSGDYGCSISVNMPIIGIGAPVSAYYPQMAEIFKAQLYLPENSEVGNAIGAITGNIVEKVEILIVPELESSSDEPPKCTMFSTFGRFEFESMDSAVSEALRLGKNYVKEQAKKAGAEDPDIKVEREEKQFRLTTGYERPVTLELKLTITAVGKPKFMKNA